jgi:cystathionine beta-lyase
VNPLRTLGLEQLRQRTSEKWRAYPADVLPLWVAELDVPLAGPVAAALHAAVELGDTGYTSGTAYAEALAGFAASRWGWEPKVESTRLVPDVMNGIVEVLRLVAPAGSAVVVNPPVYPPFFSFLARAGYRVVEAPLGADGRLDLDAVERALPGAAAYLLCSPQNPTGTVHTREELAAVAALARRHGVRVVVDEIHAPLAPPALHVPYLSVEGSEDAFALLSASKGWNLPGARAALAVAGPDAAAEVARLHHDVTEGASHLGVIAHTAALREGGPWLDALLAGLEENRTLLGDLLAEHLPQLAYRRPQATYLAWLDCRPLGLGDDPAQAFLERGRVALLGGLPFGSGGAGHARLNLGTSPEVLTEAVQRMAHAVAGPTPRV